MSDSVIALPQSPTPGLLAEHGKMAALLHAKDWSQTPLGPIEQWPQSLRTTVSLCLASNFPISIAWGPQRVQIYNDGYWPLCGDKHPTSFGQDYKECWASAWEVLGDDFEAASGGQTRFLANQRMFLDRFGYLEETFFTFSFSPIRDETGGVGGLFHPVTELTQQTLAERRLNILRQVPAHTDRAQNEPEAVAQLLVAFGEADLDLPFGLLYAAAPDGQSVHLVGQVGLPNAPALAPAAAWPLAEAARTGQTQRVEALAATFGAFASGPYPEPPHTALVFPVYLPGTADPSQPAYFLVAGVSARRALDAEYTLFFDLLASAVTSALAKARTLEQERRRAEALAELDRAKTTFFSNISHEFRTPLTLMLGPLEDALADPAAPLPGPQRERLTLVHRNTLRLQRLVNSLLDFSRLEAGRLQARFQPTDLAAFTGELASVFRSAMEKAGLHLLVDCPPLPTPVLVDPALWEKVVFNLLSNALKFTFQGEVAVSLRAEAGHAVLRVRDTGEGIAAAELPQLFARFHRVEGAKSRSHEGSGIGLALVQELVKLHGGSIDAESTVGRGTTFTVRLPVGNAHLPAHQLGQVQLPQPATRHATVFVEEAMQWLAEDAPPEAHAPAPDEHPAGEQKATLLVVDDNADMRGYVQRLLSQHPHWTVRTAADGQQALADIARHRPDLVLSDVMMPHLDGFGLLHALKQDPATAGIPVVLLSARAGEEAAVEGLQHGADDYLSKPFSARELLARVRTQLAITRTRQDNTQLRAAERELSLTNNQLRRTNTDLDTFIYTASHDLKAPIANIEGLLLALQYELPGEVQQAPAVGQLFELMNGAVARFQRTIGHLTNVSKLQATHAEPAEAVDLAALVEAVRLDLPPALLAGGQLVVELAACPTLRFSPKNLRSILYNLLSNAFKYRAPDRPPLVQLRCHCDADRVVLEVQDNGLGLSESQQTKLFKMFQRLHAHVEGTGVGLYMVKRMVENADGAVRVQSQPGVGSIFTVELPGAAVLSPTSAASPPLKQSHGETE